METKIDFSVPQGWHELSDTQLRYVYRLIAEDFGLDEVKLLCLLRWSGAKVVGRQSDGSYLLRLGKVLLEATPVQLAELLPHLDWLCDFSPVPVRLAKIGRRRAVAADFQGVAFETYIVAENLYQGYLATHQDALLDDVATALYPGFKSKLRTEERIAIFYWLASLKDFLARRFPDYFAPAAASDGNLLGSPPASQLQEVMDAQLRALTKGDPVREAEVLALDTWRALTELNAQAKEYKLINERHGRKP